MNWCTTSHTFKTQYCMTVEKLLSAWFFKSRGNIFIFLCVAKKYGPRNFTELGSYSGYVALCSEVLLQTLQQ